MAKVGRPSNFTESIKQEILERLTNGESARSICRDDHMPSWSAFCKFKRTNEDFRNQYAIAWEDGVTTWEQKIMDVACDESRDLQPDGKGGFKSDNTFVNRDRLKIDTMKWIMCKRMPNIYGDYQKLEHTGKDGKELQIVVNISGKKD